MFLVPNIMLVGYGRTQTFQCQCLKCKELFFPNHLVGQYDKTDLFCDNCLGKRNKIIPNENISEVPIIGLVMGFKQKSACSKNRTDYNYKKVLIRDEYTCQYCGYAHYKSLEFRALWIDHIKPFAAGGNNSLKNLVVACEKCNLWLTDFWFNTFGEKKEYILLKLAIESTKR